MTREELIEAMVRRMAEKPANLALLLRSLTSSK